MSSSTSSSSFECPDKICDKLANEVCWLCNLFNSPMSTLATNPKMLVHTPTTTPPSLQGQKSQLMTHRRRSHWDQAQRTIKEPMQNTRCSEFCHLREALYLISNYSGPYLKSPDKKRKAAKYLCTLSLNIRWEWLNSQVAKMPKFTFNLCTP
ncbi:hypothetical protein DFH28DRAFT_1086686 [Melampsora americana]|nr:hypothetical protein DFH28DRAFT_1086686 [Melampsora americana]